MFDEGEPGIESARSFWKAFIYKVDVRPAYLEGHIDESDSSRKGQHAVVFNDGCVYTTSLCTRWLSTKSSTMKAFMFMHEVCIPARELGRRVSAPNASSTLYCVHLTLTTECLLLCPENYLPSDPTCPTCLFYGR